MLKPRLVIATQALVVAAVFSLVLPISLISLSVGLFMLCWLISGDFNTRWNRIRSSPVAWSPLVLFALFVIGVFYSVAEWRLALYWLKKYDKLLLIPMVFSALVDDRWRQRAYIAFLTGVGGILVLSYADTLGLWNRENFPGTRNLLENRILYGALVAPACYLAVHEAWDSRARLARLAWASFAIACALGVLFINDGGTGYMVLFALLTLFAWQRWSWRGLVAGTVVTAMLVVILPLLSPKFGERMDLVGEQMAAYETGGDRATSVGQRLDYYSGALELVARHPAVGGGTGSYEKEYTEIAARRGVTGFHDNPHNEYLFITTQLGLAGLIVLLAMLAWQWLASHRLEARYRVLAQGVIVTFAVASLFDSMLQDSVVGKFYVLMIGVAFSGLAADDAIQPREAHA